MSDTTVEAEFIGWRDGRAVFVLVSDSWNPDGYPEIPVDNPQDVRAVAMSPGTRCELVRSGDVHRYERIRELPYREPKHHGRGPCRRR